MRPRTTTRAIDCTISGPLARGFVILVTALVFAGASSAGFGASPLTLDPSFGTGGTENVGLGPDTSTIGFVRAIPGGGWLAAGRVGNLKVLSRYLPSGDLDIAFGNEGVLQLSALPLQMQIQSFEIDALGRYLLGAYGAACANGPCIYRLLADGSLDPSFKNGGFPALPPGNPGAAAYHLLPLPGGLLLVAGPNVSGTGVLRLLADGSIDPAFGTGGITIFPPHANFPFGAPASSPTSLRVATGGGFYVATANYPAPFPYLENLELHRLDVNGTPDAAFGTAGTVPVVLTVPAVGFGEVEELSGGKFVGLLTLNAGAGTLGNDVLFQFDSAGVVDSSFGVSGYADTGMSGFGIGPFLGGPKFARSGGQFYVAGASAAKFAVARFNASGTLDMGFGTGGYLTADFGPFHSVSGTAVSFASNGAALAAGNSSSPIESATMYIPTAGSSTAHLSQLPRPLIDITAAASRLSRLLVAPNGSVAIVGNTYFPSYDGEAVMLDPDGLPRSGWGTRGHIIAQDFGLSGAKWTSGTLQTDGKLVIGGDFTPFNLLMRLDGNGLPDSTFGGTGIVQFQSTSGLGGIQAIGFQPADGKILAAGTRGGNTIVSVHRFLSNGMPDPGFGVNGEADFNPTFQSSGIVALMVQGTGKILVAGVVSTGGNYRWAVVRMLSNGQPDPSYGNGGTAYVTADGAPMGLDLSAAMQPDGGVLLAGVSTPGALVARLTSEGQPDPNFGSAGVQFLMSSPGFERVSLAVAVAGDAFVLLSDPSGHWLMTRLLSDGTFDPAFGVASLDGLAGAVEPAVATAGGRIVAAYTPYYAAADHRAVVQAFTVSSTPPPTAQRTFVGSGGSDVGACAVSAPCRTLAQALAHTAGGGEVLLLDSADFGAAVIYSSVSIVAPTSAHAAVTGSAAAAITIDALPNDSVTLRGLTISGGNGGIVFNSGHSLHLEGVTVRGYSDFSQSAILFRPAAPARLSIVDSTIQSSTYGINVASANDVGVLLDNVRLEGDGFGLYMKAGGTASVRNTLIGGPGAFGIAVDGWNGAPLTTTLDRVAITGMDEALAVCNENPVYAFVRNSTFANSAFYGVAAFCIAPAGVWLDGNRITHNGTGLGIFSGNAYSRGNNTIEANGVDGMPTGTYSPK